MTLQTARIKLTAFYLLIIMFIVVMFSFIVWQIITSEVERGLRNQTLRMIPPPQRIKFELPDYQQQLLIEVKTRIAWWLASADIIILVFSGTAGYFLAVRTLRPIEEMIDEQKRFIADASHELRTPLTAIKTETEVALRDKKITLAQARKFLKSNLEEIDKLKSLTDSFLSLNRFQDPTIKLKFTKVNLEEIVKKVVLNVSPLGKSKKIKIVNNVKGMFLTADYASLSQLITILIDNAIKYNNKNGQVQILAAKKNNYVIVKIIDKGIGIKSTDLEHIFDRFFRADLSRNKYEVDGYGLGLSIAKNIVLQHRGSIQAKSELNKGTTITVTLPI